MRLLLSGAIGLPMVSFEPLELLGDPGAGGERCEGQAEREEELDSGLRHCYQGEVRVLS